MTIKRLRFSHHFICLFFSVDSWIISRRLTKPIQWALPGSFCSPLTIVQLDCWRPGSQSPHQPKANWIESRRRSLQIKWFIPGRCSADQADMEQHKSIWLFAVFLVRVPKFVHLHVLQLNVVCVWAAFGNSFDVAAFSRGIRLLLRFIAGIKYTEETVEAGLLFVVSKVVSDKWWQTKCIKEVRGNENQSRIFEILNNPRRRPLLGNVLSYCRLASKKYPAEGLAHDLVWMAGCRACFLRKYLEELGKVFVLVAERREICWGVVLGGSIYHRQRLLLDPSQGERFVCMFRLSKITCFYFDLAYC